MNIRERLGKELLFLDGGMGTLLQAEGLAPGELPETWNIEHPEKVEAIHRRGADWKRNLCGTGYGTDRKAIKTNGRSGF